MVRPRIVIVGGGFAGYQAARRASRHARGEVDVALINPTDFSLYQPLLPEVAAGILEPRRIAVPITSTLPRVKLLLGTVGGIDTGQRLVRYVDAENRPAEIDYDRLVITVGAVSKVLPIKGAAEFGHGFKGLPEALYLRDHIVRQVELAAHAPPGERRARLTFVVVGAGYTGTEVATAGHLFTRALARYHRSLRDEPIRWILLHLGQSVLPGLRPSIQRTAERVLRRRGVDLRLGVSVREQTREGVHLTDDTYVPARTVVWTTGVAPDPVAACFGLPMVGGRIEVDEYLAVKGHDHVLAVGDIAAVPDLTRPGEYTGMTGQHAERQGKLAGRNVAASLGYGTAKPYKHRNLGFVVDLGGWKAAADPLGVPLSGVVAKAVTRGYHLMSVPSGRVRIAADWLLDAFLPRQEVQLGLIRSGQVPLASAGPELPHLAYEEPDSET
ncbi:NAD(P)/FAD-dependent oxidoreductase [Nonomuraea typhae]|uniref:NAD(P)/FAD-dependent oxidoreductase n=1 Tax=Nonomuraea typhae TaxID=2603600 RepID=UPI001CA59434|nr:FAD-dependent oxidoreductase [Nonomuraea typhae]